MGDGFMGDRIMDDGANVDTDGLTFEAAFMSLQETVARLESGGLSLDDAIDTFERGMALAARCAGILDRAELRVTRVLERQPLERDELAF